MFKTQFRTRPLDIGQSIEEKIRLNTATNTPNESISPMLYTDAKNGVLPQYDIRADRFEIALSANDHYQASDAAKGDFNNIDNDLDVAGEQPVVEQPKND